MLFVVCSSNKLMLGDLFRALEKAHGPLSEEIKYFVQKRVDWHAASCGVRLAQCVNHQMTLISLDVRRRVPRCLCWRRVLRCAELRPQITVYGIITCWCSFKQRTRLSTLVCAFPLKDFHVQLRVYFRFDSVPLHVQEFENSAVLDDDRVSELGSCDS